MKKNRNKIVRKTAFVFRQDQPVDGTFGDPTTATITIITGGTRLTHQRRLES